MRILIIDNQPIARTGFALLIKEELGEIQIDTEASVNNVRLPLPVDLYTLVILTADGIDQSQLEFVTQIKVHHSKIPVVVCTRTTSLSNAMKYYQVGANGVLTLQSTTNETISCLNVVLSAGRFISSDLLEAMLYKKFTHPKIVGTTRKLSRREQEIATMLISGQRSSDIASTLRLSMTTVSTFKSKIFNKIGVDNVIDLKEKLLAMSENNAFPSTPKALFPRG